MAAGISCKTCAFCVPVKEPKNTGFCYRNPPQLVAGTGSAFPPVNLKTFWCGEHKPK